MPRFKVVVQIYKTIEITAENEQEAMKIAEDMTKRSGVFLSTDRLNVNLPRNLDKPKKVKKEKGGEVSVKE